jgi:glycosyltransferase involved in cell wall biosynthesis
MIKLLNLLPKIPYPPVDGGAIAVYYNLMSLKDRDFEIVTAAFISNRHPQEIGAATEGFNMYTVPGNFKEYSALSALGNLFDARPYNLALRFDQPGYADILRRIRADHPRFDIIQLDWVYMVPYLSLCRELWPEARYVLRQHNAEFKLFERMSDHESGFLRRLFLKYQYRKMKSYEMKSLARFDAVITLTDVDKQLFAGLNPDASIHVIPAGVDLNRFRRPPDEARKKQFLILGSMGWAPYVQALIWFLNEIWSRFHKLNPDWQLIIAGGGASDDILRMDGTKGIRIAGFVENVLPLLHESAAMIVPLKSGSGMRIKIIEAMAASLPVITTSVGCEGIPIRHGSECLIGNTPEELLQAMDEFIAMPDAGAQIAAAALGVAADTFSWEVIAARTETLYRSLMP